MPPQGHLLIIPQHDRLGNVSVIMRALTISAFPVEACFHSKQPVEASALPGMLTGTWHHVAGI